MTQEFDKNEHFPEKYFADCPYSATGPRSYGKRPVLPYPRAFWEFQAILSGDCYPTDFRRNQIQGHASPSLWLFPPTFIHGWEGPSADDPSEVAVFHFRTVPGTLRDLLKNRPFLQLNLTNSLVKIIKECFQLTRSSANPSQSNTNLLEVALVNLKLSSLFIEKSSSFSFPSIDPAEQKVNQAITVYHQELVTNPTVNYIASRLHLSPTHLRRHFMKVLNTPPKAVFTKIQMESIHRAILHSDLSISQVASFFNFSEPAALSRSFRKFFGYPPSKLVLIDENSPYKGYIT